MKHASAALSPGRIGTAVLSSMADKEASFVLDEHDPNFDDDNDPSVRLGSFAPAWPVRSPRASKSHSSEEIKNVIAKAVSEYLVTFDKDEFVQVIDDFNDSEVCHEIPKIVISMGLDCSTEKRVALSDLLLHLVNTSRVSPLQIQFAFARLYNRIQDLMLDVPHAPELLNEFLRRAVACGYCDNVAAELMTQGADLINHPEELKRIRPLITKIISDYFASDNDVEEAISSLKKIESPELGHEFVKRLVNAAIDRTNSERKAASLLLASLSAASTINQIEIEKAFQSLLDGMEEIVDDVPNIVHLMSCFLARAVCDEVLTPSFVTRSLLGLGIKDLGKNAVEGAQSILSFPSSGVFTDAVWDASNSADLKEVVNGICSTYLCDNDQELVWKIGCMPAFGPILVKRLFVLASSSDSSIQRARRLVKLLPSGIVTKGLDLINARLPDLAIDVPDIDRKFKEFCSDLQR